VSLYAEPSEAVMRNLVVDAAANFTFLGTTTTTLDGCFNIPMTSAWLAAADAQGRLDLRVMINRPTQIEMRVLPIVVTATPAGGAQLAVAPATVSLVDGDSAVQGSLVENFTGTTGQAQIDGAVDTTDGSAPVNQAVSSDFALAPTTTPATNGVRWVLRQDYGQRSTVVGQWWSNTAGVTESWIYGKSSSSELGAAWSQSGAPGSYSRSKTYTSTTDATVQFPDATGKAGQFYRSFFKYGKYDMQVWDYIAGRWFYVGTGIRRTSWERGTAVTTGLAVPSSNTDNCSPYAAGSTDNSSVSKAVTWTDGVSLSVPMQVALASVTLSSRTGFTTTAKNHVHFSAKGRLCGRFGPLSHPGALIARPPA